MAKNRLLYLAVLVGCLIFYWAYGEWFSWFLLLWVLSLPPLSLLLSLPAILTAKVALWGPVQVTKGQAAEMQVRTFSKIPVPEAHCSIHAYNAMTGAHIRLRRRSTAIPTEHCGALRLEPEKAWVCDYLGLVRLPVRKKQGCTVLVCPQAEPMFLPPLLKKRPVTLWRPKPGGGFSEDHDLRPYRPGDSLRLIHWKVTAKTGKLIYREPIEALQDKAVLSMALSGSPETLDAKLGRLLWLSIYLVGRKFPHQIRCMTGAGEQTYPVETAADVILAIHRLLAMPASQAIAMPETEDAFWHHAIGGDADEV